jgi:L-threonylcarbamoyladenylate synthase
MQTPLLASDPSNIARAAAILRGGGLVAFPTETVYGLGANALDADAVDGIFRAKGRPASNPVIVHVASVDDAKALTTDWNDTAQKLADTFWPGPLTLVLPRADIVPDIVTAGGATVALRIPAHPVALALLRACGFPLAAPSANRSTELSPTRAEHVARSLDGLIDLILDGGPTTVGLESTVLDVSVSPPRLLRPGLVSLAELQACVGMVEIGPAETTTPARSPGQMAKHYAPRTPLELVEGNAESRVAELRAAGERVAWLTFADAADAITMPNDPAAYAAALYATLHTLDAANYARIIVEAPPATDAWLAVRDRLRRAATMWAG